MFENKPITLILLAYNEAETIEKEILLYIEKIVSKLPGSEFIVSEDGSTDGTSEILQSLAARKSIIHLSSKIRKGYKTALIDAVLSAKNEYVFFSDTGLKHNPDDFWKLYKLKDDNDLVVGRKINRKDQIYRRILTYCYNIFLRIFFGIKNIYDADSGFKLFNAKLIDKVFRKELIFTDLISSEIAIRTIFYGLNYVEVPVEYAGRKGESRGLPLKRIFKVVVKILSDNLKLKKELRNNCK